MFVSFNRIVKVIMRFFMCASEVRLQFVDDDISIYLVTRTDS